MNTQSINANSGIVVFHHEAHAISFHDKKGNVHNITAEGALFKGGAALAALKDAALLSALSKAINGKFRAASDVLVSAFPSIGKAADKLIGTPWANKSSFMTLCNAVNRMAVPDKGWSKKQAEARLLLQALFTHVPGLAGEVTAEVIENAADSKQQ